MNWFWKYLFIVLFIQQSKAVKLNYPRVLLPIFDKLSINFTLEVIEGGCLKWSSSRPDLIAITPVYDDLNDIECASKAVITTLFRERRRSTSLVLAKDLATGEILRCDVILDVIHQLGVLTTTRELYLEEAPETFELWAQDSQGNAFTTLEGIEFNWKISSQHPLEGKERDWQKVLRFLRFSESKYHDVPPSVEPFDRQGLRGYMVLLEGINTGSAKVTVNLPYIEYSHIISPIEVNIVVLANIILEPSDPHILIGDSISFRILQLKQGKLEDITSNTQYYLEIENPKVARINGNKRVSGLMLGRTAVILKDRNVVNNLENVAIDSIPAIQATLTVARADKLSVNLLPYYNWVTVIGQQHTISFELYTKENQFITLGDAFSISSKFDSSVFYSTSQTSNGTQIDGEVIKIAKSPVHGSFEQLKASAELQVFDKLEISPATVYLPYDPNHLRKQKIQYMAKGGDGLYSWSSLNGNLIGITQNGLAETKTGNQAGAHYEWNERNQSDFAQVKVALQRNSKIAKTADIHFLPPVKLEIVQYNFEVQLKDYVFLHIAIYAEYNGELVPLTSCDNLHFVYDMLDEIFHKDENVQLPRNQQLNEHACHLVALQADELGTSHFKISYATFERNLKAEVNLMVFEKLEILNPISNEVVLPIATSRNIIYQNGPQKVYNIDAQLVKNVQIDESIASVSTLAASSPDYHVLNVHCKKVGTTVLTLEMYNVLTTKNYLPYIARFETNVHCVKPRFISLFSMEKLRTGCPLKVRNALTYVQQNGNELDVTIEVFDAQNRKLQNISSLELSWTFLQTDEMADYLPKFQQMTQLEMVAGFEVPKRNYLITSIPDIKSTFKIKASVDGYNQNVLYAESVHAEKPEFGVAKSGKEDDGQLHKPVIENELSFLAVNSTLLPYNRISIFLTPNHNQHIPITHGSGFYEIKVSDSDIVNAVIDNDARRIIIEPLQIGRVEIDVIDRCLSTEASRLTVFVVTIGRIEVQVADRVEKTKTIEIIVRLYDSLDEPLLLDYDNLQIYELREHIWNKNILTMEVGNLDRLNTGEIRYFITGIELGETKLTMTSGIEDKTISSPAYTIQVFPPLRLSPRNSTIVLGSSIQIESHGGPQPDVNIVFSVQNENVLSMDAGLAKGLRSGTTVIIGRCIGINPVNSQRIVFSEDQIEVNVINLKETGLKIITPLRRVQSGTILPASIWGDSIWGDISPLILGTLQQSKVKWHTSQPDVIEINSIFSEAGIEYDEQDLISVRLKALNPGTAKIQAEFITTSATLSCFVEITVFKKLELELPKRITSDTIIVPPRSQINLKANLPDVRFNFAEKSILNGLEVTPDGILNTKDHIGQDFVIATSEDQTLTIPIETKNIHYILATLHTPTFQLRKIESKIPSGMKIILKVSLHDNLGNEFSHDPQDTSMLFPKLAIHESVEINFGSNFSIELSLLRANTSNMLSISLRNAIGVKYNEDFVKLSVSKSTGKFPIKKLFSIGDIICFESPLVTMGDWMSSDENVLHVDRETGISLATFSHSEYGEQITVTNGNERFGYIRYDVEIRDADIIEFFQINDIFNGKNYKAHLLIKNHLQIDKTSNVIAKNATTCLASMDRFNNNFFNCNIKLLNSDDAGVGVINLITVAPVFDRAFGAYACEMEASIADIIGSVKTDEIQLEVTATLRNGVAAKTHLKMVPAIYVQPTDMIQLEQIDQHVITIAGLDKILQRIQVSTSDPKTLEVVSKSKTHGLYEYKIRLLKNLPDDETHYLKIHSPLTMQQIEIPIQSVKMMQKCLSKPFQSFSTMALGIISNLGLIVSGLIVLMATIWAFIYCFSSNAAQYDGISWLFAAARNTFKPATIENRLVEIRLMIKSMERASKKCDAEEVSATKKAKTSYRAGDVEKARIFCETAVRHQKHSQHYQMIIAHLSPIVTKLMNELSGRSSSVDLNQLDEILKDVNVLGTQKVFSVPPSEVANLFNNLDNSGNSFVTTPIRPSEPLYSASSPFQPKSPLKSSPITSLPSSRMMTSSPRGPIYPDQSFNNSGSSHSSSFHHSIASPVYGDSMLISPNKRMNRRYL